MHNITFEEWFDRSVRRLPENKIRQSSQNYGEEFDPGQIDPPDWEKDRIERIREESNQD